MSGDLTFNKIFGAGLATALVIIAAIGLLLYQACLLLERRLLRAHAFSDSSSRSSRKP